MDSSIKDAKSRNGTQPDAKVSVGSQETRPDFSKIAAGPRTHGQGIPGKRPARGQFSQTAAPSAAKGDSQFGQKPESADARGKDGQFGQSPERDSASHGQFGQETGGIKPRGQFGQAIAGGAKGKSQFGQTAPSEMHSQDLRQRQEETMRRAHQEKFSEQKASTRFRILAASIVGVLALGLLLGIGAAIGSSVEKVILNYEVQMGSARTVYRINEMFDPAGMTLLVTYQDRTTETVEVQPEWVTGELDANKKFFQASMVNMQTGNLETRLRVTYRGIPKSFSVTVQGISSNNPNDVVEIVNVELSKTTYDFGETSLAVQGAKITYKTRSGQDKSIIIDQENTIRGNMDRFGAGLNWDYSPRDFAFSGGDRKITISHKDGATKEIVVFVRGEEDTVKSITVAKKPFFLEYNVGNYLATIGMEVQATMKDGTTVRTLKSNEFKVSPTVLLDAGERVPVVVTYIAGSGESHRDSFYVKVNTDLKPNFNPATDDLFPVGERGLEVNTLPSKRSYTVWETLDTNVDNEVPGFTLTVRKLDNTETVIPVLRSMVSSPDLDHSYRFTKIGVTTLNIRYKGITVQQNITVTDGIYSLKVMSATRTYYQLNDYLGEIVVEATYSAINPKTGTSEKQIFELYGLQDAIEQGFHVICYSGYSVANDEFTQAGTITINLLYSNKEVSILVSVIDPTLINIEEMILYYIDAEDSKISIDDRLDLSNIGITACREELGEGEFYLDRNMEDILSGDMVRLISVESVDENGTVVNLEDGNPEVYSRYNAVSGCIEQRLTFSSVGTKRLRITYRDKASGILSLIVEESAAVSQD